MNYEKMIYWLKKALTDTDSFSWKPIPEALKMAISILESGNINEQEQGKGVRNEKE